MASRGYETNGNGHGTAVVVEDPPPVAIETRRCARPGCENELRKDQRTYCSTTCLRKCSVPPPPRRKSAVPTPEATSSDGGGLGLLALLTASSELSGRLQVDGVAWVWNLQRV